MKALSFVVVLFAFVAVASSAAVLPFTHDIQSQSFREFSFDYSGGAPFCTQCGGPGGFACSNQDNWVPTQNFTDYTRVPVQKVEVIMTGSFGCSDTSNAYVSITLNGVYVDVLDLNGEQQCQCNTCDGNVTFSKTSPFGLYGYHMDGKTPNSVSVNVYHGAICLTTLVVRVTYGRPALPLKTAYVHSQATIPQPYGVCGIDSYEHSQDGFVLNDPLPENSILYAMDVVFFGTYFWVYSNECTNASMKVTLNTDFFIASESLVFPRNYNSSIVLGGYCAPQGCNGQWLFSTSKMYQNGIPFYRYGQSNVIGFAGADSLRIGFVDIFLYYYPRA